MGLHLHKIFSLPHHNQTQRQPSHLGKRLYVVKVQAKYDAKCKTPFQLQKKLRMPPLNNKQQSNNTLTKGSKGENKFSRVNFQIVIAFTQLVRVLPKFLCRIGLLKSSCFWATLLRLTRASMQQKMGGYKNPASD